VAIILEKLGSLQDDLTCLHCDMNLASNSFQMLTSVTNQSTLNYEIPLLVGKNKSPQVGISFHIN
jgi:hypothetical protein